MEVNNMEFEEYLDALNKIDTAVIGKILDDIDHGHLVQIEKYTVIRGKLLDISNKLKSKSEEISRHINKADVKIKKTMTIMEDLTKKIRGVAEKKKSKPEAWADIVEATPIPQINLMGNKISMAIAPGCSYRIDAREILAPSNCRKYPGDLCYCRDEGKFYVYAMGTVIETIGTEVNNGNTEKTAVHRDYTKYIKNPALSNFYIPNSGDIMKFAAVMNFVGNKATGAYLCVGSASNLETDLHNAETPHLLQAREYFSRLMLLIPTIDRELNIRRNK